MAPISPTDVWAVGLFNAKPTSTPGTLIEHWNGTEWSIVPSPSLGQLSTLYRVKAVNANNVWAVGSYVDDAGNGQTLVEHWDGSSWSIIPGPSTGASGSLGGLAVISATDIWAVGTTSAEGSGWIQTLIEHWDGTSWSVVPSPSPAAYENDLQAVAAVSAYDVWAVGESEGLDFVLHTLAEHWDGSTWSVVSTPDAGTGDNDFFDVSKGPGTRVSAVGYSANSQRLTQTLIEQWDGTQGNIVSSPDPGTEFNQLWGITEIANTLWSVGDFQSVEFVGNTLIEGLCGGGHESTDPTVLVFQFIVAFQIGDTGNPPARRTT